MRGDLARGDVCEVRMRLGIELVGKESLDGVAAEFAGRQRDTVNHDKRDCRVCRSSIPIGRGNLARGCDDAGGVDRKATRWMNVPHWITLSPTAPSGNAW